MTEKPKTRLLADIQEFFQFQSGLWGLLSSITILFPFSNAFFQILPIESSSLPLNTLMATLLSVFTILYLYSSRSAELEKRKYHRLAILNLFIGVLSTLVYLFLYARYKPIFPENSQETLLWVMWVLNLAFYSSIFVSFTASFTTLALAEYLEQVKIRKLSDLPADGLLRQISTLQAQIERQARIISRYKISPSVPGQKASSNQQFYTTYGMVEATIIQQGIQNAISYKMRFDNFLEEIAKYSITIALQQAHTKPNESDIITCQFSIVPNRQDYMSGISSRLKPVVKNAIEEQGLRCGEIYIQFFNNLPSKAG